MGDAPGGNYTEKVLQAAPTQGAARVNIYHDDNCAIFRGNPCNCEPVVERVPIEDD